MAKIDGKVHVRGMNVGETLKTVYDTDTKEHILSIADTYVDKPIFSKFMTLDADGVTMDSSVDGSAEPKAFLIKPKPGEVYRISRMIVSVQDSGSFDSGSYGNGIALVNGITGFFRVDGVDVLPAFDPQFPIKINPDWAAVDFDSRLDDYGQGAASLVSRFSFTKFGKYITLDGDAGEEFALYINDDLTGLSRQLFLMQGYYEKGPALD